MDFSKFNMHPKNISIRNFRTFNGEIPIHFVCRNSDNAVLFSSFRYLSVLFFALKLIFLSFVVFIISSCGTARMSVRVKSTADGTLTSNVSINGNTEGGTITPNVSVSADSSKVVIPLKRD